MRLLSVFILLFFLLISCNSPKLPIARKESTMGRIDLDEKTELSMYELFSDMEIIPLETQKESLLGHPLRKLIMKNGLYYALDSKQNSIFVFGSDGQFLKKINKYGKGPDEYTLLYDFGFNRFDGNLELMSAAGYINVYDSIGDVYKNRIKLPDSILSVSYFANTAPDKYLFFSNHREGNKMLLYDAKLKLLVTETYDIPSFIYSNTPYHHSYSPFYEFADTICFVQAYNGDVFTVDDNGHLEPKYLWDFGGYNFDISILKDEPIEFYVKHRRNVGSNFATCFLSYGENSKYYITSFSLRKKIYHLIIDKKNGKHFVFNAFKEGNTCFPVFMDERTLLFYASPSELDIAINSSELKGELKKKYDSVQPDGNPVIIKYTFK